MKHLTLVRHAKSSWEHSGLDDHSRPLNARGMRDAPLVGQAIAALCASQNIPLPGLVLISSAQRTKETAGLVLPELGSSPREEIVGDLYLAAPRQMMAVLQQADESVDHLLVIAHNPGTPELVNQLATDPVLESYPTCTAAVLHLDIDAWGLVDDECGHRVGLIRPRDL